MILKISSNLINFMQIFYIFVQLTKTDNLQFLQSSRPSGHVGNWKCLRAGCCLWVSINVTSSTSSSFYNNNFPFENYWKKETHMKVLYIR